MPLIMNKPFAPSVVGIADKTYYLDSAGELTDDEEKRAFILINEGQEIPKHMADKYGIGKVTPPEEPTAEKETVKRGRKPSTNKAEKPPKNKGAK